MILRTLGEGGDAALYRVIVPAYASSPLSGMGAARQGGRFNRPEQEALYLSQDESTALAEYKQDNPWLRPGTICTFFVNGLRVADLSAGFDPEQWSSLWADFAVDWRAEWFGKSIEPPTWYMADDVVAAGLDGILFPSQARPGGTNLVIYRSSARSPTQLRVYDPDGALQKLALR
ncbi:RES family NAD+ phosphorylase [Pseudomonas aeruginosa]|uniref:RES family NAD+ phosphorylase n=1 Tax=Pseudomonas aeruginosa TaxID=287 RepID=UPI001A2DF5D8|nr:RES family NAD+ phosphorylase [Pseudomonas aeruginosa]MBI9141210.1 RES family NAD+ phosphorylase [Pseudomonas aeruginosa]HBO3409698.1 RES family NAD+ phosphorylase [Pseudomonas aeruginosa]